MPTLHRVADEVIDVLRRLGVEHFFIVVGGNAMHLDDAIRVSQIPYTAFHNEQAAAMAAECYARLKGKIAVCVVTSGPGATNLTTGVAGAFLDSAPVLYIAGQSTSNETVTCGMRPGVRQFGTFELPAIDILTPITKASRTLHAKDDVQKELECLVQIALTGRPGPVYLEIPINVQGAAYEHHKVSEKAPKHVTPSDQNCFSFVDALNKAIKGSQRPLILAGHGVRVGGGEKALVHFARQSNIPIVTTQLAKDLVPHSDEYFVGHVGLRGDRAGNLAVYESDVLFCIGTSLQQQTVGYEAADFAPNSKKFVVDYEGSVSNKGMPFAITESVNCDVSLVLDELLKTFSLTSEKTQSFNKWVSLNVERKETLAVSLEPHDTSTPELNMYEFIDLLSDVSAEGDTVVTDAGLCFYIMGQAFLTKKNQRYIVSGGLGSMGYGLPASIGAVAADSNRVICVTGDGSAQMNVHEFGTLSLQGGNAIIFVINNGGYASIRNTQKSFFSPSLIGASSDSGILMPIWEKIAQAYGLKFIKIERRAELRNDIDRALKSGLPLLVEVICQYNQGLMPSVSSFKLDDGTLKSNPLHVMSPTITNTGHTVELN